MFFLPFSCQQSKQLVWSLKSQLFDYLFSLQEETSYCLLQLFPIPRTNEWSKVSWKQFNVPWTSNDWKLLNWTVSKFQMKFKSFLSNLETHKIEYFLLFGGNESIYKAGYFTFTINFPYKSYKKNAHPHVHPPPDKQRQKIVFCHKHTQRTSNVGRETWRNGKLMEN